MEEDFYTTSYTVDSVKDFFELFLLNGSYSNFHSEKYIFRGLKNKKYQLIPTALREGKDSSLSKLCTDNYVKEHTYEDLEIWQILAEYDIIRQFYDIADRTGLSVPDIPKLRRRIDDVGIIINGFNDNKWLPENMFAIAGLAQHYGLPTRLLDWTYDYKVALFFAVSGYFNNSSASEEKNADAILWAMNYTDLQYVDKSNESNYRLYFVRPEYFGNPNLAAQKGLFSIWQINIPKQDDNFKKKSIDRRPLNIIVSEFIQAGSNQNIFENDKLFYKFIIPGNIKIDILKQLAMDGYTEATMFPGFKSVSQYIHNRVSYT